MDDNKENNLGHEPRGNHKRTAKRSLSDKLPHHKVKELDEAEEIERKNGEETSSLEHYSRQSKHGRQKSKPEKKTRSSRRKTREEINSSESFEGKENSQAEDKFSSSLQGGQEQKRAQHSQERSASFAERAPFYLPLLLLSILLSLSFYSFPPFHRLATGETTMNMYSGFAMNHGIMPYNQIFGSSGPLFYLINQAGSLGGGTWLLWLFEVLVLWLTGIFALKTINHSIKKLRLSVVVAAFAMIAVAGISLGGNQAIEFALPFALYGILVLHRYFDDSDSAKDEVFILYGITGAIVSLIYPLLFILWIFGFFGLLVTNIKRALFGRAFYQFLASLFGFLLVWALVGYYTLVSQIFYPVIEQTIMIPFSSFDFSSQALIHFGISLALLLVFSLLMSFFYAFRFFPKANHKVWTLFLIIAALVSLFVVSFSASYNPANSLVVLPYIYMFIGLHIDTSAEKNRRLRLTTGHYFGRYLKASLSLPILGIIFIIAYPVFSQNQNQSRFAAEREVASYVREETKSSDQVLVLARNSNINLLAGRVSKVMLPPLHYPENYRQNFDIQAASAESKIIVLDKNLKLSDSLRSTLKTKYKASKFDSADFRVYKLK